MANRLPELLSAWFGLHNTIDSVIGLYLLTQYDQGSFPFLEAEFVSVVQAVESYHRRQRPGGVTNDEKFERRKQRILAAVSGKDRKWLKGPLKYSNEKRLRERITELVNETDQAIGRFVEDRERFIESVVVTRNYFTHFDKEQEQERLQGLELLDAMNILLVMLEVLLLRDLGFGAEESLAKVRATKRYQSIRRMKVVGED